MRKSFATIPLLAATIALGGCASTPPNFVLPAGKTQDDFFLAKQKCAAEVGESGGGFIFGPAIIVGIAMAAQASANHKKKVLFKQCMENRGFKCQTNCAN